jgi:hypothetical protein
MAALRPARPQDAARPCPDSAQPRISGTTPDLVWLHRRRPPRPSHSDGRVRRRAARLHGHRHSDSRAVPTVPAAL